MLKNDVRVHKDAAKFLSKLPPKMQKAVLNRLEELEDFPRIPHLKSVVRLKGTSELWFRMRVGEIRIIFR